MNRSVLPSTSADAQAATLSWAYSGKVGVGVLAVNIIIMVHSKTLALAQRTMLLIQVLTVLVEV